MHAMKYKPEEIIKSMHKSKPSKSKNYERKN